MMLGLNEVPSVISGVVTDVLLMLVGATNANAQMQILYKSI